jgi:hypothetical protein
MATFALRVFVREEAALGDTAKLPGGVATDISDFAGDG